MNKFLHILMKLKVGDRIVVPKSAWDVIQHHAIYLGYWNGSYWFIENKEGIGVRLVTAETFFFSVDKITRIKEFVPKENYTRDDLYRYALTKRGKQYDLWNYNCEHLANEIQDRVVKSKQSANGGIALFGLAILTLASLANSGNSKRNQK